MKRDWELIRQILLKIEESNGQHIMAEEMGVYPKEWVVYNMRMACQGGLIEGEGQAYMDGSCGFFVATGITSKGHDLLDQIRAEKTWAKTMDLIKEKGLDLSFDTIKAAAGAAVSSMLG